MKKTLIYFVIGLSFTLSGISCTHEKIITQHSDASHSRMIVINTEVNYDKPIIFDKEVTIYPEAFITTTGKGKIIFTKKVNIIGESQVFDTDIDVTFQSATISAINPTWFGARGYDELDDTKAFQKILSIIKVYPNSINIEIPIGIFKISKTLMLGNEIPNGKSINLIGQSMSVGSFSGSVLEWVGEPGGSMLLLKNICVSILDGIDFMASPDHLMKHNLEFRPYDYQITVKNCSLSGCAGPGSANINLNKDNDAQVSEIQFQNCTFHGYTRDNKTWNTESAIAGGKGNTKNFSFQSCSFLGYTDAAINIGSTDMLRVDFCTFALNEVDIKCIIGNTFATSNYSEQSKSFFQSGMSGNLSFTTFANNYFDGNEKDDYFIRDGSGGLILLNNNFGGNGGYDKINKISWDSKDLSHIFSVDNFYRNSPDINSPFVDRNNRTQTLNIMTDGDKIGADGGHFRVLKGE
ncbi:MAG: hypothetical protein ABI761_19565 [Saprospiraceae bacterium]